MVESEEHTVLPFLDKEFPGCEVLKMMIGEWKGREGEEKEMTPAEI